MSADPTISDVASALRTMRRLAFIGLEHRVSLPVTDTVRTPAFDGIVEGVRCAEGVARFLFGDDVALPALHAVHDG